MNVERKIYVVAIMLFCFVCCYDFQNYIVLFTLINIHITSCLWPLTFGIDFMLEFYDMNIFLAENVAKRNKTKN